MTRAGLPHSEMYGSLPACGSPYLFAAYRVLHRLSMPRHPPYALCSLITFATYHTMIMLWIIVKYVILKCRSYLIRLFTLSIGW